MTDQQTITTMHYGVHPCPHCGGRVIVWTRGERCERCGREPVPCEVYSRVVGFLRPVAWWNDGKKQEWQDRRTYDWRAAVEEARR